MLSNILLLHRHTDSLDHDCQGQIYKRRDVFDRGKDPSHPQRGPQLPLKRAHVFTSDL